MLRTVVLMRHGRAVEGVGMPDEERPLTEAGRVEIEAVGRGLRTMLPKLERVAASPLVRAQQTAAAVAEAFDRAALRACDELAPSRDADEMWAGLLNMSGEAETLLAVGHNPSIAGLARFLLRGSQASAPSFSPGMAVCIRLSALGPGSGELVWQHSAQELAHLVASAT